MRAVLVTSVFLALAVIVRPTLGVGPLESTTTAVPSPETPTTIAPITTTKSSNTTTLPTTIAPSGNTTTETPTTPQTTTTTTTSTQIPPTVDPSPAPNTTVTPPTNGTTGAPTTTAMPDTTKAPEPPAPAGRHFDGLSFMGGIILTTILMAIAVFAWKLYKARTERNYHTL